MIQRIQSLFLLLAAGCAFSLFGLNFASTNSGISSSSIFGDGIFNIHDNIALLALFGLAGALALVAIFLFKNRKTQLLLGRIAIVANVIGFVLALILFFNDMQTLGEAKPNDELGIGAPILFLVFGVLALRFINKDEKLVKSMDRLR